MEATVVPARSCASPRLQLQNPSATLFTSAEQTSWSGHGSGVCRGRIHAAEIRSVPGASLESPPRTQGTLASPCLAQQEPLPEGHGGVPRLGMRCPCPLAEPLWLSHFHVPIPALHPSIPHCHPTRDEGSLSSTARRGVAAQGGGCWVLWVPSLGTQPLPPLGLLPAPSFTLSLVPAPSLTPGSPSPQVGDRGHRAGSPCLPWGPSLEGERPGWGAEQVPGHRADTAPGQAGGCPVRLLGLGGAGGTPEDPHSSMIQ